MQEQATLSTPKKPATTLGTTPVSGVSMDDSSKRVANALGELESLIPDDPYLGICIGLWKLLSRKRGYYGCVENPLENALGVLDEGIEPWVYQLARIGEKCRRLRGMIGTDRTIAIRETLSDIAGHAVVAMACQDRALETDLKEECQ